MIPFHLIPHECNAGLDGLTEDLWLIALIWAQLPIDVACLTGQGPGQDTSHVSLRLVRSKEYLNPQSRFSPQILNVSAIVLANLCVSYIMTSQNEEAEELMRKIEKEEEQLAYEDPDKKIYHLCIVNLVIG